MGVTFFVVSGGPYGLEPLVAAVGPSTAIALVLLVPLLWSLPIGLMVAELAGALPREGGYYCWAGAGLGPFWGVQQGWLALAYAVVDMALYPVLFVNYLTYFCPSLGDAPGGTGGWAVVFLRLSVAGAVIAGALVTNWRGARAVGASSLLNALLVLLPFGLITVLGFSGHIASPASLAEGGGTGTGLLALGLSTVLWNYCGFDNISTFADEVRRPQHTYPRALAIALPLIVVTYLLPLLAGLAVTTDPRLWSEATGWPLIGKKLGGEWLGTFIAATALCSAYSMFNSQLFYVSRLPYAMARDGWLPAPFARACPQTGVPRNALLACCVVAALFAALPFGKLVILDILLYSCSLALQFAALIALRRKRPHMDRPFRIPGGLLSLSLLMLAPMGLATLVLITSLCGNGADPRQALILAGLAASGVVVYFARRTAASRQAGHR